MYNTKGLFVVRTELFEANKHLFKGLEYQAQAFDDGFTRIVVTDRPRYPGNPIQYMSSILGQSMARVAY